MEAAGMLTGMLKRWCLAEPDAAMLAAAERLSRALRLHPLAARLLAQRGLAAPDDAQGFLKPRLNDLHDPVALPGLVRAAQRLARAVDDRQPIVIYGDYDVDGVTASAILWHTLTLAGAKVHSYIPHRIDEGYGLNSDAIRSIAGFATDGDRKPLIVSVDCGITAVEPARVARELGIDLIITDHHEFDPADLPEAYALVHPRLPVEDGQRPYPFADLCGAGVAFKLAWQVAKVRCGSERVPEAFRDLLLDLLAFAALGTVADVAPLMGENRTLTVFGLSRIKQTRFVGLNALVDASRLRDEKIDAYHVGFVLGPRLNACGRMGHAREALHLLTDAQHDEAHRLATFLTQENDRRRQTERAIFAEACDMVAAQGYDTPDRRAIVLGKEGWHPGVVGIVASRLVERFGRPVVMLNYENGSAHGSARSVDGVSIHEAFHACAEHLDRFGGHAMAAGLHLSTDRVAIFRDALVCFVNDRLPPEQLTGRLDVDATCTLADVTLELFEQLQRLAPFGRGNPSPLLCLEAVRIAQPPRRVGATGQHLQLALRDDAGRWARAIAFGRGEWSGDLPPGTPVDVVFTPRVSVWQGQRRTELHVQDVRVREP